MVHTIDLFPLIPEGNQAHASAGCAVLDAIRAAFPLPRLRIADRGLREGMLLGMMRADDLAL